MPVQVTISLSRRGIVFSIGPKTSFWSNPFRLKIIINSMNYIDFIWRILFHNFTSSEKCNPIKMSFPRYCSIHILWFTLMRSFKSRFLKLDPFEADQLCCKTIWYFTLNTFQDQNHCLYKAVLSSILNDRKKQKKAVPLLDSLCRLQVGGDLITIIKYHQHKEFGNCILKRTTLLVNPLKKK